MIGKSEREYYKESDSEQMIMFYLKFSTNI